ncbi:restriction endonuclease subunit S [Endozoicomonas sp. SCSIO W0465]|uniref:restriction endonuclease subunit S n=1 Tax=Endozoicomonas sp. SCSIO W0465 TaxID=2918516 RepID=UPI002074FB27|nr:restriction endonuclease subunit S [Endozoicomonas sp. SCSIO W0465]USE36591.1 restriction endonuclease subunit S [Endozoicomonas sp. SCSIO W0465]
MCADWPVKKLSDVAEFLNSKRIPLKSLDRAKRQGEYPYYGASGIVDHIDDYIFDGTYLVLVQKHNQLKTVDFILKN